MSSGQSDSSVRLASGGASHYTTIEYELADGIATITLNRPDVLNAMNDVMRGAVVKGLGLPLADGIRLENDLATLLRTTEDRVEGAKAFLEKRPPRWSGR